MSKELKAMILELTSGMTDFQVHLLAEILEQIAEDNSNNIVQKNDLILNLINK